MRAFIEFWLCSYERAKMESRGKENGEGILAVIIFGLILFFYARGASRQHLRLNSFAGIRFSR